MYTVDCAVNQNDEWNEALQSEIEEDAVNRADALYQMGFEVIIWDRERKYWENGRYVTHVRSVFEEEWRRMCGGDPVRVVTSLPPLMPDKWIVNGAAKITEEVPA